MKIYTAEKELGLEEALACNSVNSLGTIHVAKELSDHVLVGGTLKRINSKENYDSLANSLVNEEDITLYSVSSILVTTGINRNDDIFLRDEVFLAKDTPKNKPFNLMHNERDIIGHMVDDRVVALDLSPIDETGETPKEDFHIVSDAVIYTKWRDEERMLEVTELISELESNDNKWFVSMEAVFDNFDYGVISSDGKQIIVERNESTAFLTQHLRIFGGTGTLNGNEIGGV